MIVESYKAVKSIYYPPFEKKDAQCAAKDISFLSFAFIF